MPGSVTTSRMLLRPGDTRATAMLRKIVVVLVLLLAVVLSMVMVATMVVAAPRSNVLAM